MLDFPSAALVVYGDGTADLSLNKNGQFFRRYYLSVSKTAKSGVYPIESGASPASVGRSGDKEIDFVCNKRGEKLYVQVAYLLASDETVAREFGAYDNIRDNYPKYVVSLDEFDMSRNGIKHRNIRDFLLAKEWN